MDYEWIPFEIADKKTRLSDMCFKAETPVIKHFLQEKYCPSD